MNPSGTQSGCANYNLQTAKGPSWTGSKARGLTWLKVGGGGGPGGGGGGGGIGILPFPCGLLR